MNDASRLALLEAFDRAWGVRDLDALMDLMADDCEFRSSVGPEPGARFTGRDEVRRGFALFLGSGTGPVPETEGTEVLIGGEFAVTRWALRLPQPDGPPLEVRGCDVFEFAEDRIRLKDTYRKVAGVLPGG